MRHRIVIPLLLVVLFAGCSGLFGGEGSPSTPTAVTDGGETPTTTTTPPPTARATVTVTQTQPPTPTVSPTTTDVPTGTTTTVSPARDPDGDGLTTYQERSILPNASPCRMDVFVEVDWVNGSDPPSREAFDKLIETYAEAPVDNPDGTTGIDLHLVLDEQLPNESWPDWSEVSLQAVRSLDSFDNEGRGYHYAVLVPEYRGNVRGMGRSGYLIAKTSYPNASDRLGLQIFAHELGHSLGFTSQVFDGIDGFDRSYREYPSVMSYAGVLNSSTINFSDGTNSGRDHDDWEYLEQHLYSPSTEALATDNSTEQGC